MPGRGAVERGSLVWGVAHTCVLLASWGGNFKSVGENSVKSEETTYS